MNTGTDTLRVLEWPDICAQLAALAYTSQAATRLESLRPLPDFEAQNQALAFVGECLERIRIGEPVPLRRVSEMAPILKAAAAEGSSLEGDQLIAAADFFGLTAELSSYGKNVPESTALEDLLGQLVPAPDFCGAVSRALDSDGAVKDDASPALRTLRRQRQQLERTLLGKLEHMASSLSDDSVVTLRGGRYVVSVPDRYRDKVPGLIHDRSQSGTTLFVEPLSVMELGNALRDADADIRDEIQRILRDLSARLHKLLPQLKANLDCISELDFVYAKARWADHLASEIPQRDRRPELKLVGARHPLLLSQRRKTGTAIHEAMQEVVPFGLHLGDPTRVLIISGPNTGGKTVCLKAMGLAVVLVHAGVPAPVAPESVVGCFDAVFADIGDDQSLALSLSTFSAHLKHVGEACRRATSSSLVLLDELGVGTDPEEGGALAQAVVDALLERQASLVLTTHYNVLKLLSQDDARIANAAFLFDERDLAPTYELVVGRPGQSYALEVARRLEFPEDIVARAEHKMSRESRKMSALIARLEAQERETKAARQRLLEKESRLDALLEYNEHAEQRWSRLQADAEAEARREAARIVAETRRETERLVRDLRQTRAAPHAVKRTQRALQKLAENTRDQKQNLSERWVQPGMQVEVSGLNRSGEVTRVSDDGQRVWVQIDKVSYTVGPDRLSRTQPGTSSPRRAPSMHSRPTDSDRAEIDLRGKSVAEAQLELGDTLPALAAQGVSEVRVIHGRGTGTLRRELASWFRRQPWVGSTRRGSAAEGGDGVTVVTLKAT